MVKKLVPYAQASKCVNEYTCLAVSALMPPPGLTENTPGSVPLGIHENVTRSSITRKNGRSAAFLTALTGRSAALAKPVDASAATDNAAATMVVFRNDILSTPKLTVETI